MTDELRFDGRVVIITGAGNGLGRAHALLFGSRGAKVVVNDLGGSAFGDGKSSSAADRVVEEIRAKGGEAVANYDSVEDGGKIVQTALDAFGRVDVVINNAGILRDTTFHKMSEQDWDLIFKVHVKGAFAVTHAAWPHMREQKYGRVVFTTSAAGIYGNFGQTNYSAAKLAQLGMGNTLALEGRKAGIVVNTIAPIAGSRLTETVMPKEVVDALKPEVVSPLVAYLCHESCEDTGGVYEVGGGFFAKLRTQRTRGKTWRVGRDVTPEMVRDTWEDVTRFDDKAEVVSTIQQSTAPVFENIQRGPSKGGNQFIDVDSALGYQFAPIETSYDERDLALYALGVGAARNPLSAFDLQLVYEGNSDGFRALPSYAVIPALNAILTLAKEGKSAPGLRYGLDRLLHGEQYLELKRPLPQKAKLVHKSRVADIWDKGKSAVVVTAVDTYDEDGELLAYNEVSSFVRGAGGWGGDRGPAAEVNVPPERAPDASREEKTDANQALLYRLSGDWNPLHADPGFAKAFGFSQPILHGLCTFGFSVRHVLEQYAPKGDPGYFKSVKVRFAESVFPGETLITEMWKESDTRIVFRTKVKERDKVVISNAAIELFTEIPKAKAKKKAAPAVAAAKAVEVEPQDVFRAMHDYLGANPDVAKKVGTVYQFKLRDPDSTWTVDVKGGSGVTEGETQAAQCTLELSTSDFLALTRGEAKAQQLFGSGKLKLGGDMMAAMKLDFLGKLSKDDFEKHARARWGAGDAPAPAEPALSVGDVMAAIGAYVGKNRQLVKEVGKVFAFQVLDPESTWTLDLKESGAVSEGETKAPDCTFRLSEADFLAMVRGEANPQKLFSSGKLKLGGDMMAAMKLGFLSKLSKEDLAAGRAARSGGASPAGAAPTRGGSAAAQPAANVSADPVAPKVVKALATKLASVKGDASGVVVVRAKDPELAFTIDFGAGAVREGEPSTPECIVTLKDSDLVRLVQGEPLARLHQTGALRVDGDIAPAKHLALLGGLL
ncbi:MAG: SDR family NAD(P)-dependent oxidoreductase [Polyangiales bacterium]